MRKKGGKKVQKREKKVFPEFEGRVQMTREGFAFVIIEGEDDDVYVKASKTRGALNGDIVRVAVTREATERSRREGEIVAITERSRKPFVGILQVAGRQAWVIMESRNMPYDIQILTYGEAPGTLTKLDKNLFRVNGLYETVDGKAQEMTVRGGMKVAALVDDWQRGDPCPQGHLVDVLGEPGENDTEMHAILAEYALPYRFEPEVENAADHISDVITEEDLKGRRDFRDTLTLTIDPIDAKDFDDALSFKALENGNYEVGVHIADVSYYVTPGSIVDKEARERGTSVYLVDRTVPMLPEKLSNKLCSLRPNEDKLTFSAVFEITPLGRVASQWFGRTVINSDYRFAYETAQQIIDAGDKAKDMDFYGGTDGKYAPVGDPVLNADGSRPVSEDSAMGEGVTTGCRIPDDCKEAIMVLHKLAGKLRKKRFQAGAISFERPEMKVEVDEKGRPIRVYQKISKEANWLIEEFMLLANRSVAEFVATGMKGLAGSEAVLKGSKKAAKPFVYRIHDEPNQEKLANLGGFVHNFGYNLGPIGNGKEISKTLNSLFEEAKDKPEFNAIELLSLRTMAKAKYDTDNIGHYGLAFKYYTHFTSPIRRYPDTIVHRTLAKYLAGGEAEKKDALQAICKYCSERECIAADAERASIKYKLVEFMQDKVGYEFEGHISGLTEWGMYVEIEPTKIEGMVALRDIRSDFFEFDQDRYRIVGRRTGITYSLGDPVRIQVKKTNLAQKLLDYELVETGDEKRDPSRRFDYDSNASFSHGADGVADNVGDRGASRKFSGDRRKSGASRKSNGSRKSGGSRKFNANAQGSNKGAKNGKSKSKGGAKAKKKSGRKASAE